MKKIIGFISKYIEKILPELTYENCYVAMRKRGYAHDGRCSGLVGGDSHTENLNYNCIDCPYLDLSFQNKCKGCFGAANNDCKYCKYFGG